MPPFLRPVKPFRGTDVIAKKRIRLNLWAVFLFFCVSFLPPVANAAEEFIATNTLSIVELQNAVSEQGRVIRSFRLEGVVCAVVREQKTIVLQDDSATVLLELPFLNDSVDVGERVAIEGDNCSLVRDKFGVRIDPALVLDNEHDYGVVMSGSTFLGTGLQPIHLKWFNNQGDPALDLEYEGPGVARQKVPRSILWQRSDETNQVEFRNGLHFESYVTEHWKTLSDFDVAKAIVAGTATNIDIGYGARSENVGLKFDGYLKIDKAGIYTFHLSSQDGSILYVGDTSPRCRITVLGRGTAPPPQSIEQAHVGQRGDQWIRLQGEVTFAGWEPDGLELELSIQGAQAEVTVINNPSLALSNLLHKQIKVVGICESPGNEGTRIRVVVPSEQQIEIQGTSTDVSGHDANPKAILVSAYQVRSLKPDEAKKNLRVKIRGVIIWASSFGCVLQDSTGGVYVHFIATGDESNEPRVGDLFEIEGTTDPGDFSPVVFATKATFLKATTLPEPIQPTWDQLMNGSLDAEYVEVRGVITEISPMEMTLLTPEGKLTIIADESVNYPLPSLPALSATTDSKTKADPASAFVGSVVRIRGCLTAIWDLPSRQLRVGVIHLAPAILQVDEMAPSDPFSLPTTKVTDLLRFDPRASAFNMTKVAGQIINVDRRECYLSDEGIGLRIPMNANLPLHAGDFVEAVGFPELGGPSPVLQSARVRKISSAQLPAPIRVPVGELLNHNYDSTLVRIKATLINDTVRLNERVLELEAGPIHFLAKLNSEAQSWARLPSGSQLDLTGVYVTTSIDQASPNVDPFELLLNDASNIVVLQKPSWWTVRHAITIVVILAGALALAFIWITVLRRKIEERTLQLQEEIETRQLAEQRRAMEQERSRVARDLHDELGAGLTEVGFLGALAKNPAISSEEKKRYLDQLTESTRTLVTGLDEIVWAINPHYDSVGSLATYYSLFAQRFLNLAGIACRLQVAENFPEYALDPKLRHNVFLAFKEALNNTVRHSGAKEAEIKIEVIGSQLRIAVHDNGHGFEAIPGLPGSDGLTGMRERLRQLGGECLIKSGSSQGTNVEFHIPLNGILT
jgi:signal transduction histidine kinase